jgi:hypothetical protein
MWGFEYYPSDCLAFNYVERCGFWRSCVVSGDGSVVLAASYRVGALGQLALGLKSKKPAQRGARQEIREAPMGKKR